LNLNLGNDLVNTFVVFSFDANSPPQSILIQSCLSQSASECQCA